jgi:hypothetical protein
MRYSEAIARVAVLAVAMGFVCAACTSGPSLSQSPRPQPSTVSPAAHGLLTKLHQQTEKRFVNSRDASNRAAVIILTSARNLQPGQQGAVLKVRKIGNLIGSCRPRHPAVKIRLTYHGPGPPTVTEIQKPLARPASLYLLGWAPTASPRGGKQQFRFFQIVAGGEEADFALALWATLTPVAGGCTFAANAVLRVRCSAPSVADIVPVCSYVFRRHASTQSG